MMKRAFSLWWSHLAERERRAIALTSVLLLLILLWQVGIAPAWRVLRDTPSQKTLAATQLQQMQAQAAWVKQLQDTPAVALNRTSTLRALETATQTTVADHARTEVQPDQVRVTLEAADPAALADWLRRVRLNAALLPKEAELSRNSQDGSWSGTLVLHGEGLLRP